MTEPIPDDSLQRRTWLIAGVLAVVVVLVGVGIAFALLAMRPPAVKPAAGSTPIPSSTVASSSVTSATANSTTTSPTGSTTTSASAQSTYTTTTPPGQIVRAARIAYRLRGQIWVAGEDGSGARAVAKSASDAFSLSPDGKTLVLLQGTLAQGQSALLIDVASGVQAAVKRVPVADLPTWAPDSSWLAYTSGSSTTGYSVHRVNSDGSGDSLLISGAAAPSIAPDGKHVAFEKYLPPSILNTGPVQVYDVVAGTKRQVLKSEGATYFTYASGGVLFFVAGGSSPWLGMASKQLSASSALDSSVIANVPLEPNAAPGPLIPSPDGSRVLFSMMGDTGYSRMRIADVAVKTIISVASPYKLDQTPTSWLLDGSGFFYVYENAQQQQHVSLYRMNADGTHPTPVIDGAGL